MAERIRTSSILVVDDSPTIGRQLEQALQADYRVRIATNGRDALETVAEDLPDLILLDLAVPDVDGYEFCKRLKAHPLTAPIPVILLTLREGENNDYSGLEAGAADYIAKPISMPLVRARIRTHLELRRYRDLADSQSSVDSLTGITNRRRFNENLRLLWANAQRRQESLALILIEVDNFKGYVEQYGLQAADECLIAIARALTSGKRRPLDMIARFADEEFVGLLPNTDAAGAVAVAESLSTAVAVQRIPHVTSNAAPFVTVSIGVTSLVPGDNDGPGIAIDAADQALYRAKRAGRNRVSC